MEFFPYSSTLRHPSLYSYTPITQISDDTEWYRKGAELHKFRNYVSCVKVEGSHVYSATYGGYVYRYDTESALEANASLHPQRSNGMNVSALADMTQEEVDPESTIFLRPPLAFPVNEFYSSPGVSGKNSNSSSHHNHNRAHKYSPSASVKPFFQCTSIDLRNGLLAGGSSVGLTGLWRVDNSGGHGPESEDAGTGIALWADHIDKVNAVQWVGDEALYTIADDGYFRARDLASDSLMHSFMASACPLTSMATLGPDTVYLGSMDGEVRQIDLRARGCVNVFKPTALESSPIRCLLLADVNVPRESYGDRPSPAALEEEEKQKLQAQSNKKTTARTGAQRTSASPRKKTSKADSGPALSHQTTVLYVSHGCGEIKAWDLRQPRVLLAPFAGHSDAVCSMTISEGMLITGGDDGRIRIYDTGRGSQVDVLSGHAAGITSLAVTRGLIFSGSYDKTVRQYSLSDVQRATRARAEEEKRLQRELALHQQQLNEALALAAQKAKKKKSKDSQKPTGGRRR